MSLVDYCSSSSGSGSGGSSEAEGEEDEGPGSRPRGGGGGDRDRDPPAASTVRPRAAGARKRGGGTETVRIPAPDIIQSLSDDDDDDEPVRKRTSQGTGSGLGLSALLPQPRSLTLKEGDHPFQPYPFTKGQRAATPGNRPPPVTTSPSPSAIKAASKNAARQLARHIMNEEASEEEGGRDEDEEEEDEEEEEAARRRGEGEQLSFFTLSDSRSEPSGVSPQLGEDIAPTPAPELPLNPADAPLEFNRSSASALAQGVSEGAFPPCPGSQYPAEFTGSGAELPPPPYYQDYYSNYYQEPEATFTPAPEEELNTFMNDEAFKRLQGKRNRGKEEVSFVEIKGDEQLSGSHQWLMKSLTEEKDMKSFSKKRGEQPTSQQRRKHQITYLIHQAKERELELKNAWSDNRLSKRQTQAKYGF